MDADSEEEKMYLGQIPKPLPSRLRPKSISTVLNRLFQERGYASQQSRDLLEEHWREAVGDLLSSQSKVGQLKRGQLQVYAANDIVRSELEYQKSKILQHLQTQLPLMGINGVRIHLQRR
jgi:predicted nucleic acid-binding Zn ribbon protein